MSVTGAAAAELAAGSGGPPNMANGSSSAAGGGPDTAGSCTAAAGFWAAVGVAAACGTAAASVAAGVVAAWRIDAPPLMPLPGSPLSRSSNAPVGVRAGSRMTTVAIINQALRPSAAVQSRRLKRRNNSWTLPQSGHGWQCAPGRPPDGAAAILLRLLLEAEADGALQAVGSTGRWFVVRR